MEIPDINSASDIIENSFERCIRACQWILLNPACQNTLQNFHRIIDEFYFLDLPYPAAAAIPETYIHTFCMINHNRNHYDRLKSDGFHFLPFLYTCKGTSGQHNCFVCFQNCRQFKAFILWKLKGTVFFAPECNNLYALRILFHLIHSPSGNA